VSISPELVPRKGCKGFAPSHTISLSILLALHLVENRLDSRVWPPLTLFFNIVNLRHLHRVPVTTRLQFVIIFLLILLGTRRVLYGFLRLHPVFISPSGQHFADLQIEGSHSPAEEDDCTVKEVRDSTVEGRLINICVLNVQLIVFMLIGVMNYYSRSVCLSVTPPLFGAGSVGYRPFQSCCALALSDSDRRRPLSII